MTNLIKTAYDIVSCTIISYCWNKLQDFQFVGQKIGDIENRLWVRSSHLSEYESRNLTNHMIINWEQKTLSENFGFKYGHILPDYQDWESSQMILAQGRELNFKLLKLCNSFFFLTEKTEKSLDSLTIIFLKISLSLTKGYVYVLPVVQDTATRIFVTSRT